MIWGYLYFRKPSYSWVTSSFIFPVENSYQLDPIGIRPQMFRQTDHLTHDVVGMWACANVQAWVFCFACFKHMISLSLCQSMECPKIPEVDLHGPIIWPEIVAIPWSPWSPWSPWYRNHYGCPRTMKTRPKDAAACSGFHVQGDGGMAIAPTRMKWMKISWNTMLDGQ